jgi:hypothetical protein
MYGQRFLIEIDGLFQVALHLAFIGLLEKVPGFALVLFTALALL